jgi:hypothetical protein
MKILFHTVENPDIRLFSGVLGLFFRAVERSDLNRGAVK